jgi:hypothetical protein
VREFIEMKNIKWLAGELWGDWCLDFVII